MDNKKRIEKIRKIRELYDSFEYKDMSWEDFLSEFTGLTSSAKMQGDLAGIMQQKQTGRSNQVRIDEAISSNSNNILLN